jgi:hypothetical protein
MNDRNDRSADAADWYPDPVGRHQYRYWDGISWTHHVADDGKASVDPLAQAPRKARGTTVVAAGHDSKPPNKPAHAQKPQGQDVRRSTLRGEASASDSGTSWRTHPTVEAWLGQCQDAGYCTPDDVEALRTALALPKYQMHDFLTDALLPEIGRRGAKFRNRKLVSGSYAPPAVTALPRSEVPLDLSAFIRSSSTTGRYERPRYRRDTGARAAAAAPNAQAGTSSPWGVCKAFRAGRCVVQGADTGPCDWDPTNWRICNVVIQNMKYGGW